MKSILSTKVLTQAQKELVLNAGLHLVEFNAIEVSFLAIVKAPKKIGFAIVSSKNGAEAVLKQDIQVDNFYCVGEKTKTYLAENGQNVLFSGENGLKLSENIQKHHKTEPIYYFCSDRRRNEIPSILQNSTFPFYEITAYQTLLTPKQFDRNWDAVMFFSPSGVESYFSKNKLLKGTAVCIGLTTAEEAKKYTANTVVANSTTTESVIAKTVKTLKVLC